jgi:exosome complex component RRP4
LIGTLLFNFTFLVFKKIKSIKMSDFVVPGQPITSEAGYLRGHGAYLKSGDNEPGSEGGASTGVAGVLISSIAGRIERVNKLISVKPLRSRCVPGVTST